MSGDSMFGAQKNNNLEGKHAIKESRLAPSLFSKFHSAKNLGLRAAEHTFFVFIGCMIAYYGLNSTAHAQQVKSVKPVVVKAISSNPKTAVKKEDARQSAAARLYQAIGGLEELAKKDSSAAGLVSVFAVNDAHIEFVEYDSGIRKEKVANLVGVAGDLEITASDRCMGANALYWDGTFFYVINGSYGFTRYSNIQKIMLGGVEYELGFSRSPEEIKVEIYRIDKKDVKLVTDAFINSKYMACGGYNTIDATEMVKSVFAQVSIGKEPESGHAYDIAQIGSADAQSQKGISGIESPVYLKLK